MPLEAFCFNDTPLCSLRIMRSVLWLDLFQGFDRWWNNIFFFIQLYGSLPPLLNKDRVLPPIGVHTSTVHHLDKHSVLTSTFGSTTPNRFFLIASIGKGCNIFCLFLRQVHSLPLNTRDAGTYRFYFAHFETSWLNTRAGDNYVKRLGRVDITCTQFVTLCIISAIGRKNQK